MVDKGVKPAEYRFQRVDAIVGAILAAFVAMSIIVATGATIGGTGPLTSATHAAHALRPVAGPAAEVLFGLGPPRGLGPGRRRRAPLDVLRRGRGGRGGAVGVVQLPPGPPLPGPVHGQILVGAAVVLVPGNLITLILNTQVLEGVITPMTLILILVLANRRSLLGSAANGPWARWLGGASILSVAAVASVFVVLTVLGWFGLS